MNNKIFTKAASRLQLFCAVDRTAQHTFPA